ncbi:MAG: type VI secretion system ImpA family N-terminal domain-containing protein, partial [Polyangiaceae bacterium]|nr:type VI secretion system ImpA family N-terminal domain-containing protein [Polyangiaceae bacterium]
MAIDDVIAESRARLESLLAPINGGVGTDVSFDESFEKIKTEVDKMQSLAGGKVDWAGIVSGADEILSDKSKDFRVALYYATGKAQLDGLLGLLDGLVLLNDLSTNLWEAMYPSLKRPKARGNLANWYSDTAATFFAEVKTTSKDGDLVGAIDKVSREVDGLLRDKLGDAYPGMGNLRNLIRGLVANTPKEAPPPPPPPPP